MQVVAEAAEQLVVQRPAVHGVVAHGAHHDVARRAGARADDGNARFAGVEVLRGDVAAAVLVAHDDAAVFEAGRGVQHGRSRQRIANHDLRANQRAGHVEALAEDAGGRLPRDEDSHPPARPA